MVVSTELIFGAVLSYTQRETSSELVFRVVLHPGHERATQFYI